MRGEAPWLLHKKKEPFRIEFNIDGQNYIFAFPTWPASAEIRAREARRIALRGLFLDGGNEDKRMLAAVVWKAARYLEQPETLRSPKLTLNVVSRYFRITPRKVRYAASKLLNPPFSPAIGK
jgi:hypothetical protein